MDEFEEIERLLGAHARRYAENKRRGGDNSEKGWRFERMHALHEIARLASEHMSRTFDHHDTRVRSRIPCFVDDFEITTRTETTRSQIKDVADLFWNSGDRPLSDDFRLERKYSLERGIPVSLKLVVSNDSTRRRMLRSRPHDLSFVDIEAHGNGHIPSDIDAFPILLEHLRIICWPIADTSTLQNAACYLMSGWDSHRHDASLQEILARASAISQYVVPTTERNAAIDDTTFTILSSIDDFAFAVRGETFAYWTCGGMLNGVAPFRFGSNDWDEFVARLDSFTWDENGSPNQLDVEDVIRLIRSK